MTDWVDEHLLAGVREDDMRLFALHRLVASSTASISGDDLYRSYLAWVENFDVPTRTKRSFLVAMKRHNPSFTQTKQGTYWHYWLRKRPSY